MNLGAFAVAIAVARRTGSAEIETYAGLGQTSPWLAVTMTFFLFSLAGIPPFAGWFAKFVLFRAVLDANSPSAVVLGVIAALGSVVAFFYYAAVARKIVKVETAVEPKFQQHFVEAMAIPHKTARSPSCRPNHCAPRPAP